jgi:hypothetical protein
MADALPWRPNTSGRLALCCPGQLPFEDQHSLAALLPEKGQGSRREESDNVKPATFMGIGQSDKGLRPVGRLTGTI